MAEYLDLAETEGYVMLFWIGFHAGIGWVMFDSETNVLDYCKDQITMLNDAGAKAEADQLQSILDTYDEDTDILPWIRGFSAKQMEITKGFSTQSTDYFCTVDTLSDYASELGIDDCKDREEIEEVLLDRFGEPIYRM